jgi:hypothetical protein
LTARLEDLFRSCVVRVCGGPRPGAGFFVAPGMVVTCMHVIGSSTTLTVRWDRDDEGTTEAPVTRCAERLDDRGRPIPALDWDYPDIAVLEIDGLFGHPCVAIDHAWPGGADSFQVFGYPSEGGATLLTPARLSYRGTHGTVPTLFLDLASDTIKPGMSGAPLLNLRTGGVCGVIVASKDISQPSGALAIPWSAVEADLDDVETANEAFHQRDSRWEDLRRRMTVEPPPLGRTSPVAMAAAGAVGFGLGSAGRPTSEPEDGDDDFADDDDGITGDDDDFTGDDDDESGLDSDYGMDWPDDAEVADGDDVGDPGESGIW